MCSIASTSRRSVATGVCRASSDWIALLDLRCSWRSTSSSNAITSSASSTSRWPERVQRAAQHAQDELALLLQARLELVELFLEADAHLAHPNRPVT